MTLAAASAKVIPETVEEWSSPESGPEDSLTSHSNGTPNSSSRRVEIETPTSIEIVKHNELDNGYQGDLDATLDVTMDESDEDEYSNDHAQKDPKDVASKKEPVVLEDETSGTDQSEEKTSVVLPSDDNVAQEEEEKVEVLDNQEDRKTSSFARHRKILEWTTTREVTDSLQSQEAEAGQADEIPHKPIEEGAVDSDIVRKAAAQVEAPAPPASPKPPRKPRKAPSGRIATLQARLKIPTAPKTSNTPPAKIGKLHALTADIESQLTRTRSGKNLGPSTPEPSQKIIRAASDLQARLPFLQDKQESASSSPPSVSPVASLTRTPSRKIHQAAADLEGKLPFLQPKETTKLESDNVQSDKDAPPPVRTRSASSKFQDVAATLGSKLSFRPPKPSSIDDGDDEDEDAALVESAVDESSLEHTDNNLTLGENSGTIEETKKSEKSKETDESSKSSTHSRSRSDTVETSVSVTVEVSLDEKTSEETKNKVATGPVDVDTVSVSSASSDEVPAERATKIEILDHANPCFQSSSIGAATNSAFGTLDNALYELQNTLSACEDGSLAAHSDGFEPVAARGISTKERASSETGSIQMIEREEQTPMPASETENPIRDEKQVEEENLSSSSANLAPGQRKEEAATESFVEEAPATITQDPSAHVVKETVNGASIAGNESQQLPLVRRPSFQKTECSLSKDETMDGASVASRKSVSSGRSVTSRRSTNSRKSLTSKKAETASVKNVQEADVTNEESALPTVTNVVQSGIADDMSVEVSVLREPSLESASIRRHESDNESQSKDRAFLQLDFGTCEDSDIRIVTETSHDDGSIVTERSVEVGLLKEAKSLSHKEQDSIISFDSLPLEKPEANDPNAEKKGRIRRSFKNLFSSKKKSGRPPLPRSKASDRTKANDAPGFIAADAPEATQASIPDTTGNRDNTLAAETVEDKNPQEPSKTTAEATATTPVAESTMVETITNPKKTKRGSGHFSKLFSRRGREGRQENRVASRTNANVKPAAKNSVAPLKKTRSLEPRKNLTSHTLGPVEVGRSRSSGDSASWIDEETLGGLMAIDGSPVEQLPTNGEPEASAFLEGKKSEEASFAEEKKDDSADNLVKSLDSGLSDSVSEAEKLQNIAQKSMQKEPSEEVADDAQAKGAEGRDCDITAIVSTSSVLDMIADGLFCFAPRSSQKKGPLDVEE